MAGYIGSQTPVVSNGSQRKYTFTATAAQTVFTGMDIPNPQQIQVFQNGVRLVITTDYTVSSGTTVTLVNAASAGDSLVVILFADYQLLDTDALTFTGGTTIEGDLTVDTNTLYVDSTNNRVGVGTVSPSATLDVNGTIKLDGNYPTGTGNVALGDAAMNGSISGNYNTALGDYSMQPMTSGASNTGVGGSALRFVTSGSYNTAVGHQSLHSNTTASNNTAVGYQSLYNSTDSNNTALGYQSGLTLSGGHSNLLLGAQSGYSLTNGSYNVSVGRQALYSNTTASNNTAVGYQAGYSLTTGQNNAVFGLGALDINSTGNQNTAIGTFALEAATGSWNTGVGYGAGYAITTGFKNTILGAYNGNQGGLDIRTSNNNIVLSDGDGNPRVYVDNGGSLITGVGSTAYANYSSNDGLLQAYDSGAEWCLRLTSTYSTQYFATFVASGSAIGSIQGNGSSTSYNTTSDHRLKENVVELSGATDRLKQLEPKRFNFIVDPDKTVDGFLAHEVQAIVPEAITGTHNEVDADGNPVYQGIDQSKLVPLLVATIKELEARITALETENTAIKARLDALEGN